MPNQKIELIDAIAIARGTKEPTNRDVFWLDKSSEGGFYDRLKSYNYDTEKWELVSRSSNELLTDLKTVDGAGSGLDSDTLRGYTPEQLISSGASGLPPLSTGKIIVGQGDTIGQAKTLGGIATIDANGSMAYVTNSISHTGLTDVGTNTHVQIDSHIADSAIHLSAAQSTKLAGIEAGATTDQTDAEIETAYNNQVPAVTQAEAEAGTVTTIKRWTPQRVKQAIDALSGGGGGNTIYTADDSLTADRIVDCDNNKLSFDVGTLASGTSQNIGVIIDGSNIFYGGGGTSSPLLNVEGQLGNVLNVNTGGFLISKSDFSNAIASFSNRLGTRGLSLNQGTNVMASEQFEIKQQFSQSTGGIIFNGLSNNTQMYFREGSAIQHWIRTGSAQRVHFFSQGMSASFIIGSGALIGSEKISLQAHTAIKGENTLSTSSALQIYDGDGTPNLLVNFKNNGTVNMSSLPTSATGLSSGDIYNDSGTLKIV